MALEDIGPGHAAYIAASAVLFLFAGWLVYLSPRQRATRALALVLIGMGVAWVAAVAEDLLEARAKLALHAAAPIAVTTIGLSTIYFLSVYPRARGWIGRSPGVGSVFLGAGIALAALFVAKPDIFSRLDPVTAEFVDQGPLYLLGSAWTLTSVVMLLFFARDATRAAAGPVRRSLLLVLAAFLTSILVWTGTLVFNDVTRRLHPSALGGSYGRIMYVLEEVAFFGALLAAAIVIAHGARSAEASMRREAGALAGLVGVCLLAVVIVGLAGGPPHRGMWSSDPQRLLDAAGGIAIAGFAGYALLKHRLFDIDVKLRWTISRGTVAAIFVGVFFIASQVAQNFLEDSMGWALGGVIAGVMLFAIAPLQRVADRVAVAAVPAPAAPERKLELYRLALALALSDRSITRNEERHLARLAEELGVTHTEALAAREAMENELGILT